MLSGRAIDGAKGSMKEGGSRVPLIVSWKGTTPAGQVLEDLTDFSDFFPTFAELAGAKLPEDVTIDGRSLAPQLMGRRGDPRQWIFVQLSQQWYVRDAHWKLNNQGELFDMKDAPFRETLVEADSAEAQAARAKLQAAMDVLRPGDSAAAAEAKQEKPKKEARKRTKPKAADEPKRKNLLSKPRSGDAGIAGNREKPAIGTARSVPRSEKNSRTGNGGGGATGKCESV
jgi:arylsulfatase A-like enzyme